MKSGCSALSTYTHTQALATGSTESHASTFNVVTCGFSYRWQAVQHYLVSPHCCLTVWTNILEQVVLWGCGLVFGMKKRWKDFLQDS